jgi:ectoine hydroxylase-related dioxygenase (phytanoyl-CoA dioxygenase family)
MVEQLIGRDVILWGSTVFHKPPGVQRVVPWHRDGRYWPIKPLATTSVWIAITDTTAENGCLQIIPGSHAARDIGRHFRDDSDAVTITETLYDDQFDPAQAREIALEAGQMVIFDVYTVHGSPANESTKGRIGYALRYMPATSHYDHHDILIAESRGAAHSTRPLIQVRGIDKSGLNDFSVGHPG